MRGAGRVLGVELEVEFVRCLIGLSAMGTIPHPRPGTFPGPI